MDLAAYIQRINNCDISDPLLSQTELGKKLDTVRLEHVMQHLLDLYQALDIEQLLRTDHGLPRDYRGLGELMDLSADLIETRFKRSYRPTKSLIEYHINKNLSNNRIVTVNNLVKMLEQLERFDIIDDLTPTFIEMTTRSANKQQNDANKALPEITTDHLHQNNGRLVIHESSIEQLTIDDGPSHRIMYDAFVCFAPEDYQYAQELIGLLEDHGKRVATADDLLPGHFEHDALVKLIATRCRRVLTVLTPSFLRSKECELQTKFASEIALRSGESGPKIIPVLFEPCDNSKLPYMIQVISKIDMTNRVAYRWQLQKLLRSLDHQPEPMGADYLVAGPSVYNERNEVTFLEQQRLTMGSQAHKIQEYSRLVRPQVDVEPIIDLASSQYSSDCFNINTDTPSKDYDLKPQ